MLHVFTSYIHKQVKFLHTINLLYFISMIYKLYFTISYTTLTFYIKLLQHRFLFLCTSNTLLLSQGSTHLPQNFSESAGTPTFPPRFLGFFFPVCKIQKVLLFRWKYTGVVGFSLWWVHISVKWNNTCLNVDISTVTCTCWSYYII